MDKHVLLIGRNSVVLSSLASALTDEGFTVKTTTAVERANQDFNGADFNLIAFGRGVNEDTNSSLRGGFAAQNPNIIFVDGLAPVIPLLVKQITQALSDAQYTKKLTEFTCLQTDCSRVRVTLLTSCRLTIDLYELDAIHTTRQQTLISEPITAGTHTFTLLIKPTSELSIKFLAAQADNRELLVLPLR